MPPALHEQARRWQRDLFDAGFAGIHWPPEYGGQGLARSYTAIWAEECARAGVQHMLNLQGIVLAGEALLRSGTAAQLERFARATLSGDVLWCQLFSEPGAGSDLASLRTTAERDGDCFVINGQKVWCSNGQFADFGILLARTDPAERGHRGISFFLIEMNQPGIEVRPVRQMTGDSEFCEVFFDHAHVPVDLLLGELNGGWNVAMGVLTDERGTSGNAGVISLARRLDELAAHCVDAAAPTDDVMRLIVRGRVLGWLIERTGGDPALASASKLLRTELEFDLEEVQARHRGASAMLAGAVTDRFLYAPGMRIAGGTSEIQRNIIGERVLGLPR